MEGTNEIIFYNAIYDESVGELIEEINEVMGEATDLRILTSGGSVFAAYGMYTKMREHGDINLKVDGCAMSGGAFLPLFAKTSQCLSVSRFVFHRADMWVCDEKDQAFLDGINADLKGLMKKKIDAKLWKEVTGYSLNDLFDPTKRIDISLTGKEAKKVGLVDNCIELTPQMEKEIKAHGSKYYDVAAKVEETADDKKSKIKTMDMETLKAENPALYKAIMAKGKAAGIEQEKERVKACLAFLKVDAEGVIKMIKEGTEVTMSVIAEYSEKAAAKNVLAKVENEENPPAAETEEVKNKKPEAVAKEKQLSDFQAAVKAELGMKVA